MTHWSPCRFRVAVLSATLFFSPAVAEETLHPEKDHERVATLSIENDLFAGSDANYTNGIRLAVLSAENNIPSWLDNIGNGHKRWHFELGQSIFTPSDLSQPGPQPDDRPYAGWLYGGLGVISDTGYRLDNLQLTLGMVGPASGAAQIQDFVHDLIDSPDPQGWRNQLSNEFGVVVNYERKWRSVYQFSPFGWGADITPSIGGSIGNIYTHALIGAVARIGYDLPSDYGPPLIRPSMPGSDFFIPRKDFGWYLFAGAEGRAVARNIFLDGNTFKDSPGVDKYPLIGGLQAGIAFTFGETRLAYTHSLRSREFHGQDEAEAYGALTLSRRF